MSKSFSFVLTLNIVWFSLSTCYDETGIHYAQLSYYAFNEFDLKPRVRQKHVIIYV